MSEPSNATYEKLCRHARETALLESVNALLEWDDRTGIPPAGGEYRAEQITYLAGMIHRRRTDPQLGEWLAELAQSPLAAEQTADAATTIRELKREYDKQIKQPQSLVEELARLSILGQQRWVKARKDDDFKSFAPLLVDIVRLKRQQAECLGYEDCMYDALLDEFEPDAKTSVVRDVLAALREDLVPLVAAIAESKNKPDGKIVERSYPIDAQRSFGRKAAEMIGFDFARGRLDRTHHPFCTDVGPNDCRITTRYDEHFFPGALFSTLHEAGHGIYDQGLRTGQYGLPPGRFISHGIHESQSRMWENLVGRSRAFWQHLFGDAQRTFPEALADVSLDEFHFAVNDVRPSLIRTEADEATYNLHIIVRFELEQALLEGDLSVDDLPGAWNESYRKYLGIVSPDDADGVLQDVHWSAALFGYFPTYTLGNLYASQLFAKADAELGGLDEQFARGEFEPLRGWLRKNVHEPGQRYSACELIERVTGKPLSHDSLITHLRDTFGLLYGIS